MTHPLSHGSRRRSARRPGGFTLMEVLVALIVLAIGLLGLAALQAQGLKFNHDAYVRTQATVLAYDVIERMRTAGAGNAAAYTAADPRPGTACDDAAALKSADVTTELACWYKAIENLLPGGVHANTGITNDPAGSANYVVTIAWLDRQSGNVVEQRWSVQVD